MRLRSLLALATAHFVGDSYSSFLAPLLPLLMQKHDLGLKEAGTLVAIVAVFSNLMQPAWGYLADRRPGRLFAVAGPLLTAFCISSIGLAPNLPLLILALALGGCGMAAFHPEAAALARVASGPRKAFGMSLFISAGNLGFALGPLFATGLVVHFGLPGTGWALAPGLLGFFLLLRLAPPLGEEDHSWARRPRAREDLAVPWAHLINLFGIVILRALVSVGFLNFLPVLFARRSLGLAVGGALVTLFLLAGAVGGVLGGYAAERIGNKPVMASTLALATPFLLVAVWSGGFLQVVGLVLGGGLVVASHPVNVNLAQSLAPRRAGIVAAFMIGFGIGVAGLTMPAVGALADAYGVERALALVALAPAVASLLVLPLPSTAPVEGRVPAEPAIS